MSFDSNSAILAPLRQNRREVGSLFGDRAAEIFVDPGNLAVDRTTSSPTPTGAPPTRQSPEVEVARKNARERMLRARGRSSTQSAGLLTNRPSLNRPALSDTLG